VAGPPATDEEGGFLPDPDRPGWLFRPASATGRFVDLFGACWLKPEPPTRARLRIETHEGFTNHIGTVHGGLLMALADQALFIGAIAAGVPVAGGVTVDTSCQFLGSGRVGVPLDVTTEVLKETGRMVFVRGLVEQDGASIFAFSGTLRKPRQPDA